MAFTPMTLNHQTTLYRTTPAGFRTSLVVQAGETVQVERIETDSEVILNVRLTRDGFVWTRQQRRPRHPECVPSPASSVVVPAAPVAPAVANGTAPHVVAPVVPPVPSVPSAPLAAETTAARNSTARDAKSAIEVLSARQIHSTDRQEARVRQAARVVEMLTGEVYQLNYYIPSCLNDQVENPSRILRRHAFRLDGSNWVIPQKGLEHKDIKKLMKEWDNVGVVEGESSVAGFSRKRRMRYWVVAYTKEQLCKMKESAQDQLAEELQECHRALLENIENAAKDLQAAQEELPDCATAKDRDALDNRYNARMRRNINEACERFEMCLKGAEIFDDTGCLDSLFEAVRDAIRVRALVANRMLAEKHVKQIKIPASIMTPTATLTHSIGSGPAPR